MKTERKIQKTGNAYTLYLPTKWVTENSLQRGSTISVTEGQDGTMLLSAHRREAAMVTHIEAKEAEEALHSAISAYVAGATEIILSGEAAFTVAAEARNRLSGVEIVEETPEGSKLKVFVDPEDVSQKGLLKRMQTVTLAAFDLVQECLGREERPDGNELGRMDDNVDRLHIMLLRVAYQSRSSFESISNSLVAKFIERVCDHVQAIGEEEMPKHRQASEILKEARAIYESAFASYWGKEHSHAVCVARAGYRKKMGSLSVKKGEMGQFITHCTRIVDYATDIAEITGDTVEYNKMMANK